MANVSYSTLGCKVSSEVKTIDFANKTIEVKQYLPIQEKLLIMQTVIELSMSQYNYANPVQVEVYTYLNVLQHYTNIKFTDKQLEDPAKLYDQTRSSGLLNAVIDALPEGEFAELIDGIDKSVKSFYAYRCSVLGILDVLQTNYSDINGDLSKVLEQIKDPEALKLIKQIAPLLGAE